MIPAILSCVFVAYLYHSLNLPSSQATASASTANSANSNSPSERLDALEMRLQQLLEKTRK